VRTPVELAFCLIAQAGAPAIESPLVQSSIAIAALVIVVREGVNLIKWLQDRRNGGRDRPGRGDRCIEHGQRLAELKVEVAVLKTNLDRLCDKLEQQK